MKFDGVGKRPAVYPNRLNRLKSVEKLSPQITHSPYFPKLPYTEWRKPSQATEGMTIWLNKHIFLMPKIIPLQPNWSEKAFPSQLAVTFRRFLRYLVISRN